MGSDSGPAVLVEGALQALRQLDSRLDIVFIGDEARIRPLLEQGDGVRSFAARWEIVHSAETVGMEEDAAAAVRRKKDSSLAVGMRLMKEGRIDALFSAGSTGATVAAALEERHSKGCSPDRQQWRMVSHP